MLCRHCTLPACVFVQGEEDGEAMAQATEQIAAASAPAMEISTSGALPATASHPQQLAQAATAASAVSKPDGHDFESAASTPDHLIPVTGVDLTLPYVLRSADDLKTPYTNYTSGYKALLDYVW